MEASASAAHDGRLVGFVVGVAVAVAAASVIWATNTSSTEVDVVGSEAVATTAPAALTRGPPGGADPTRTGDTTASAVASTARDVGPRGESTDPLGAPPSGPPEPTTRRSEPGRPPQFPVGSGVPGVSDTEVFVGLQTADIAAFNAAAAATGAGSGEGDYYDDSGGSIVGSNEALLEWFNEAHAGIAGRQVRAVHYEILASDAVTPEGRAQSAQAACAKFAEDEPVFTFNDAGGIWTEGNILQCAVDHNIAFVQMLQNGIFVDRERYAEVGPNYLTLNRFMSDERDRVYVDELHAQGFFDPDARVGILIDDIPAARRAVERVLEPRLEALGVEVAARAVYPDIIEAPWQTYVLSFRQAEVTHVLFSTSTFGRWPTRLFLRAAEDQLYRPRYGMSTENTPQAMSEETPIEQWTGMQGVGWLPVADVAEDNVTDAPHQQACEQAVEERGEDPALAIGTCEYLFLLKPAVERGGEFSPDALHRGLAESQDLVPAFGMERTTFRPGDPGGVGGVRHFAFFEDCTCVRYTSGLIPVE